MPREDKQNFKLGRLEKINLYSFCKFDCCTLTSREWYFNYIHDKNEFTNNKSCS